MIVALALVAVAGPLGRPGEAPALERLVAAAGWTPAPELSGIFEPGTVFEVVDGAHRALARGCVAAAPIESAYTATEMVTELEGGVSFGGPLSLLVRADLEGSLVRTVRFATPIQRTLPTVDLRLTPACLTSLGGLPADRVRLAYLVQEALVAEITEQTCGKLDAEGKIVGLGKADVALSAACTQASQAPVTVGMRTVPLGELLSMPRPDVGCPWPSVTYATASLSTLTLDGVIVDVRGSDVRSEVAADLAACGYRDAADLFSRWRSARRTTNGCAIHPITALLCTPFAAATAGARARALEQALRAP